MPTALSAPPQTLPTAAAVLRHRRPRRRRPSPLALSPYRTRGREGGPKSKRAAASGSRSRGAPNRHLPPPLDSSVSPYPAAPGTPSRTGGATAPQHARAGRARGSMAKLYVQAVPPPDLNKNTEWFMYLGSGPPTSSSSSSPGSSSSPSSAWPGRSSTSATSRLHTTSSTGRRELHSLMTRGCIIG
ncbi:hypothetical protein VPH35_079001 [Triticum aestivum]